MKTRPWNAFEGQGFSRRKVPLKTDHLGAKANWGLKVIRLYLEGAKGGFLPQYPPEPTTIRRLWKH